MPIAAIGVGLGTALAGGATAAAGLYGAHKQSEAADNSARLQSDAAKAAAAQQDATAQRAEAFQRQQAENEWRNSERVQRANYDQQKARLGTIAQFGSQYGVSGIGMPDYVPGTDPGYDTGASPIPGSVGSAGGNQWDGVGSFGGRGSAGGKAGAAELKALLDGGMDPQQAVAQFNKQYGRTTGNEAVYYDPSQHGGVAAIGLPDAYLAKPGGSWDITQRAATASKTGTIAAAGSYMAPLTAPRLTTGIPEPYQPGTIAAYGRMR